MGLKKLVKKVTKPIGKAVKKIVPKELAGIMQVAAPFYRSSCTFLFTLLELINNQVELIL